MIADLTPLVLFVCTGNQIRSPLSAAIFQKCLNENGLQERFRVESAGTWTLPGHTDPLARVAALRMGLDIEDHQSRMVDEVMISKACLVVVMEQGQKEALEVEYPQVRGKVQLLSRLAGEPAYNISDPSGKGLESYLQVGEELEGLINSAYAKICRYLQTCQNPKQ